MQTLRLSFLSIALFVLAAACAGDVVCNNVTCAHGQACVTDPRHGEVCATLCGDGGPCTNEQSCERVAVVPPLPAGIDHDNTTLEACVANQ